ncbi:hypothetical protein COS51_00430 [Candidatus Roizmanbacteria bacterium CG03_land_8_20_14_0_80_36_21]|uniref:PqqD family protein n=1 Tax=Candidatus Roizmanbacteria bacterium CG23_combo_of_CG06-09_8_20_14_all_35_49 TaxID=1974863 RepID=A0A2G9Y7U0_9BACT|nr:MAG: hypothetical protein COX47_00610 [Candidatus Roizmanbacteria bacterium CG23_combo_of_CG06-09_8_20_14_all_35_49]PIV09952.1 MAG: hypothetical protein COS51_00430 [Candidatus Roizmanbacteria bacterium CG03_land_8_20_14_0_80_36_21]PJA53752.1 MAG: hypothetical protein CO166_00680 [Candidatus Roizmanbacteria bacterium CG_4_9_14_3_um_filter_36_11]
MNSLTLNQKPLRLWEWREYKSGSLIENGIALNDTGTFIWKLCDGKTTINEIIAAVIKKYDVEKQNAEKDVLGLIQLLIEENALKIK